MPIHSVSLLLFVKGKGFLICEENRKDFKDRTKRNLETHPIGGKIETVDNVKEDPYFAACREFVEELELTIDINIFYNETKNHIVHYFDYWAWKPTFIINRFFIVDCSDLKLTNLNVDTLDIDFKTKEETDVKRAFFTDFKEEFTVKPSDILQKNLEILKNIDTVNWEDNNSDDYTLIEKMEKLKFSTFDINNLKEHFKYNEISLANIKISDKKFELEEDDIFHKIFTLKISYFLTLYIKIDLTLVKNEQLFYVLLNIYDYFFISYKSVIYTIVYITLFNYKKEKFDLFIKQFQLNKSLNTNDEIKDRLKSEMYNDFGIFKVSYMINYYYHETNNFKVKSIVEKENLIFEISRYIKDKSIIKVILNHNIELEELKKLTEYMF